MPETIRFPFLPNIQPGELCSTVKKIAQHLQVETPDFRNLRKTLRTWKIWDKEKTPSFLEFIRVNTSEDTIEPGPFLTYFLEIPDVRQQNTIVFQYLNDLNPLLVKAIFEALDTEKDGRIQSTNELYRLITSYVYPGEHLGLPDFQNWVAWMQAAEVLRTIGLRWGLGPVGTAFLEEIRQIDMEELLVIFGRELLI